MLKKTLFRAFLALLALGAFTLQSRADVITTNADPWMSAAGGNPQTGPPLIDILRLSVDGGRIFTNQTTGTPFAVGSTIKTVGVFTVGTAHDGTNTPVFLPDGSTLTVMFGIQGTITSNAGGLITATFTTGEAFFASKSTGNPNIFDINHPGTWNFANTFAKMNMLNPQNVFDGNLFGIVPEDIFSSGGAASVSFPAGVINQSSANTSAQTQAQGRFLFGKDGGGPPQTNPGLGTHTGNNWLNNFDTIGGPPNPETQNGGLLVVTNQTVLSTVPSSIGTDASNMTAADLATMNAIAAASGFTGGIFAPSFGPGGAPDSYDPTGFGAGTGDFVADLTGDQYPITFVAAIPEPSSLVLFGIAAGVLGLHSRLRRRRRTIA